MSEQVAEAEAQGITEGIPLDDGETLKDSNFLAAVVTGKNPLEKEAPKAPDKPLEKAPEKPPEAKADAPVDPDDESKWVPPAEIKSTKGQEGWKAVKLEAKTARQEAAAAKAEAEELRKQLAERPTIPPDYQERYAALEKERDDYSERLKVADVTSHPQFRHYFDSKTKQFIDAAKNIVGEGRSAEVERILKITDPDLRSDRLDELMSELTDSRKTRLGSVLTGIELLEQERRDEISKAGERYKQIEQQTRAQQEASVQARNVLADKLIAAAAKMEAFDPGEKPDAGRLAEIENYKTFVRAAVTGTLDGDDAKALPLAAVQGLYLKTKMLPALQARIADLEKQIAEYENAKPRGGLGVGSESSGEKSFMSIMGIEGQ